MKLTWTQQLAATAAAAAVGGWLAASWFHRSAACGGTSPGCGNEADSRGAGASACAATSATGTSGDQAPCSSGRGSCGGDDGAGEDMVRVALDHEPTAAMLTALVEAAPAYKVTNPWWMQPVAQWLRTGMLPVMDPPIPQLVLAPSLARLQRETVPAFGRAMRERWFQLDPDTAFLNHGSYGSTIRHALEAQRFYQRKMEENPVLFMEDMALTLLVDAIRALSAFVGARPQDLALVPNATTGVNAVVRSFPLKQGDVVLSFSVSYGAVLSTIDHACQRAGARLVRAPFKFPFDSDACLATVKQALADNPTATLAVLDHITSMPAVVLPIKAMVDACHVAGVKVLVDGAHAVGQLPLDLTTLGADFYTSNLHKWLCTPKGTAFLWVAESSQHLVRPTTISHGYGMGFACEFFWPATYDFSAYLSITTALAAFERAGVDRIRTYNHSLVVWAAHTLTRLWGTAVVHAPSFPSCLATVELPVGRFKANGADAVRLARTLRHKYKVEIPVSVLAGKLYTRLSAQMYNTKEDYERLGRAVLELQQAT